MEIGLAEILLVLVVAVLLYGENLPSAARKAAQVYVRFRRYLNTVRDEIERHIPPDDPEPPAGDPPVPGRADVPHFDPARATSETPPRPPDSPAGSGPEVGGPGPAA